MASKIEPLTEGVIYTIAKTVGLDVDKLKASMNSTTVTQKLKQNETLAQSLQLMGTPALFVAKTTVTSNSPATDVQFIPGQVNEAQLTEIINKANK